MATAKYRVELSFYKTANKEENMIKFTTYQFCLHLHTYIGSKYM